MGIKKLRFSINISLYLGNNTKQGPSYRTTERQYESYEIYLMVLFPMTLSDLEWLSEIYNDNKHRAASLRQLRFLFATGDAERGLLSSTTTETLAPDDAGKSRASSHPTPRSASAWTAGSSAEHARKPTRTTASQTVSHQQQPQQRTRHRPRSYIDYLLLLLFL